MQFQISLAVAKQEILIDLRVWHLISLKRFQKKANSMKIKTMFVIIKWSSLTLLYNLNF